ncbi:hypothetical protein D3C72_1367980 [compost metagenome]
MPAGGVGASTAWSAGSFSARAMGAVVAPSLTLTRSSANGGASLRSTAITTPVSVPATGTWNEKVPSAATFCPWNAPRPGARKLTR